MNFVLASGFQTGAILTLVLPVALLAIVACYWWFVLRQTDLGEELDETAATDQDAR
jgi:ribose/xylose/arabinose/galactoside ABC-type transport system permease subunit